MCAHGGIQAAEEEKEETLKTCLIICTAAFLPTMGNGSTSTSILESCVSLSKTEIKKRFGSLIFTKYLIQRILYTPTKSGLPNSEGLERGAGNFEKAIPIVRRLENVVSLDLQSANPAKSNTIITMNNSSEDFERFLMLHRTMPVESDPDIQVLIRGVLVGTFDAVRRREMVLQSLLEPSNYHRISICP